MFDQRRAMCLWDFSWYTQAGEGDPYENLDDVFDQVLDRGFTAVRICAAPMLLFGGLGLDSLARDLPVEGMGPRPNGGYFGEGTRWYNARGGYRIDVMNRFFRLLETAARRGVKVVLSSWEYQQSTSFAADDRWYRAIDAVPQDQRLAALARAADAMMTAVDEAGLTPVVSFVELHNEVDYSWMPRPDAEASVLLDGLRGKHPSVRFTLSYGKVWKHLDNLPHGLDVGQFHVYAYGVLDMIQRLTAIRQTATDSFPNEFLRSLQKDDSPTLAEYGCVKPWKLEATVVTDQQFYGYDTLDAAKWDTWLYDHYPEYEQEMYDAIATRMEAASRWGARRGVPVVIGESWVGYTPLYGLFEESEPGHALAEHGMALARALGAWMATPSSNAAPHHPMWEQIEWLRRVNAQFVGGKE